MPAWPMTLGNRDEVFELRLSSPLLTMDALLGAVRDLSSQMNRSILLLWAKVQTRLQSPEKPQPGIKLETASY